MGEGNAVNLVDVLPHQFLPGSQLTRQYVTWPPRPSWCRRVIPLGARGVLFRMGGTGEWLN